MAQIATLTQPVTIDAPLEDFQPIPVGALEDTYVVPSPEGLGVVSTITNRFPVPPTAGGFLTDVLDENGDVPWSISGLTSPYLIIGAIYPESAYLEPTIGQIWPRTG